MAGLEQGIADEAALGLVRFRQIQAGGGDHGVMSVQKRVDLDRLAGVVGRHDQPHPLDKLQIHPDHALRNNLLPKFNIVKRYVTCLL